MCVYVCVCALAADGPCVFDWLCVPLHACCFSYVQTNGRPVLQGICGLHARPPAPLLHHSLNLLHLISNRSLSCVYSYLLRHNSMHLPFMMTACIFVHHAMCAPSRRVCALHACVLYNVRHSFSLAYPEC
jgi:hypothetical protein